MKKLLYVMSLLIIASMVLTACGRTAQQATPNSTASPAIQPTLIPTVPAFSLSTETPIPAPTETPTLAATSAPTATARPPIEALTTDCPNGVRIVVSGFETNSGSVSCLDNVAAVGDGTTGYFFDVLSNATIKARDSKPDVCVNDGQRFYTCTHEGQNLYILSYKVGSPKPLEVIDGQIQIPVELTWDMEDLPFDENGQVVSFLGVKQSHFSMESQSYQWQPDKQVITITWYNDQGVPTWYFDMPLGVCLNGWILSLNDDSQPVASFCR